MHRHTAVAVVLLALMLPGVGGAQSSADERERARIERERARERAREQVQRAREQAERARDEARERQRERLREQAGALDTTVAFEAAGSLDVSCPQGDVVVVGHAQNEIVVRARTGSGGVRFTSTGSRATLEPASGRGCSDGRFEVRVPAGTRVTVRSASGGIEVTGVRGDLEARGQSADIRIRDAGRVEVETLSGDVALERATGSAAIRTVSGDVVVTAVRGDVDAESVSGDLALTDVTAKQVRAHTTSGDITFSGAVLADGRYEYDTHSGEISLALPAGVGAQLTVATFSGGIESSFPLTLQPGREHGNKRLTFTLGQGTARIVAETFSGDIILTSGDRRR